MKKLLILLAVVSVTMTGCLKNNYEDKYKDYRQGLAIYSWTTLQNTISLQSTNAAVRLAILMAEADKQGIDDLNEVKDGTTVLRTKLLGYNSTIIDKGNGVYEIKYVSSGVVDMVITPVGSYLIDTKGKALSESDRNSWWTVVAQSGFSYQFYLDGTMRRIDMSGGETTMYNNGDNTYSVQPLNIQAAFSDTKDYVSNWSGSFTLTAPSEGLAYSDCKGKLFGWAGRSAGPTFFYYYSNTSPIGMSYQILSGKYLGGSIREGVEECELTSNYEALGFPAYDFISEWGTSESGEMWRRITYNGKTTM